VHPQDADGQEPLGNGGAAGPAPPQAQGGAGRGAPAPPARGDTEAAGPRRGIAPGSFLDLVMRARDRTTGHGFTDLEIANQARHLLVRPLPGRFGGRLAGACGSLNTPHSGIMYRRIMEPRSVIQRKPVSLRLHLLAGFQINCELTWLARQAAGLRMAGAALSGARAARRRTC